MELNYPIVEMLPANTCDPDCDECSCTPSFSTAPSSLANKVKGGEKMGKGAPVEIVPRKGLADISNLPQNNQVARKSQLIPTDMKGYIEKLKQTSENVELLKLVLERNKIIEMRGIEL